MENESDFYSEIYFTEEPQAMRVQLLASIEALHEEV